MMGFNSADCQSKLPYKGVDEFTVALLLQSPKESLYRIWCFGPPCHDLA